MPPGPVELRPVALVVLVVLAGCVGGGVSPPGANQSGDATTSPGGTPTTDAESSSNGSADDASDGGNSTPAEGGMAPEGNETAPAENATAADGGTTGGADASTPAGNETFPPGVNASGVEDAEALVAAHRSALNNTSFAFRFQANVSVGPAVQWTTLRGQVEPGLAPLVVHSTSVQRLDDDTSRTGTDVWANGTAVVVRYRGEEGTELRRYNRTGDGVGAYDETWAHLPRADLESQVTQSWLVELALTVGDYRLERTERRDGRRVAVLRATEPVAAANFTDLNATVEVDETGLVHRVSLTATAAGDDETHIRYEFAVTDVGSVAVERPQWVDAATPPNRTTTAGNATTTAGE